MSGHVSEAAVSVRYAETDQMGFAYYANYLAWFEVGRCEWLRSLGWSYRDLEVRDAVMLPVIEAHCEYRQPARYDDELLIRPDVPVEVPIPMAHNAHGASSGTERSPACGGNRRAMAGPGRTVAECSVFPGSARAGCSRASTAIRWSPTVTVRSATTTTR